MDTTIGWVLLVTTGQPCCNRRGEPEENAEPTAFSMPNGTPTARLSPLGALYRREYERLHQQRPSFGPHTCDQIIVAALARLFLDADEAEIAQAMIEGSPNLYERTSGHIDSYVLSVVKTALDATRWRKRSP